MKSIKEVERWAISVLDRVVSKKFSEDSLVELKASWPDSYKAARRIAAHANGARGEDVLWIVGIDAKGVFVSDVRPDLALFLPQVWQYFDGPRPEIIDVEVEFADRTCTVIAFDTSRAPYSVKNPEFGSREGVVIEREIPWRDGTRVRTAKRDEVIRMTTDIGAAPEVEPFSAEAFPHKNALAEAKEGFVGIRFVVQFYVMPRNPDPVTIPHHRVESFVIADADLVPRSFHSFDYTSMESYRKAIQRLSSTGQEQSIIQVGSIEGFEDTGSELIVTRACHLYCYADVDMPNDVWIKSSTFRLQITYYAGIARLPFVVSCEGKKKDT